MCIRQESTIEISNPEICWLIQIVISKFVISASLEQIFQHYKLKTRPLLITLLPDGTVLLK